MKCIITYLQCKRAVLPYLFGKYCFPKMKEAFPGDMELYHIHHNIHQNDTQLSTSTLDESHLNLVNDFIKNGMYPHANIIQHNDTNRELAFIPSVIRASQIAIENNADLHLWIEDDAIVYDPLCWQWPERVGCPIGTYRNTPRQKMVVCAYFISRLPFDQDLIPVLRAYKREPHWKYIQYGSQYERLLFMLTGQRVAVLNENCAFRHHPYDKYTKTRLDVEGWLKKNLPISTKDLDLLKLDFKD